MPTARLVVALLALTACSGKRAAPLADPAQWRADLHYITSELPARHARAYHTISRERFAFAANELDVAIPTLNDDQVLVGLMRLVAMVGDGHTHLDLPPHWPRYPVEFAWFGGELRIVGAAGPNLKALGTRVTAIGGIAVDSVMTLAATLVPRGENDRRTRLTATMLLTSPRVLHGLGLTPPGLQAVFGLADSPDSLATLTLNAIRPMEITDWHLAAEPPPLWLRHLDVPWWSEVLPDSRAVYLSFSQYPAEGEFQRRSQELGHQLDQSGARRIIIDLRRNEGGDLTLVRRYLLPLLQSRRAVDHPGGVYVLIGPGTFSAAMVNALDFRDGLHAILVGEPTGARPNSYSEHGDFLLPDSALRVSYSTRYYRFSADTANAVQPDRRIEPTWQEFKAGRDPVLDWVLSQPAG